MVQGLPSEVRDGRRISTYAELGHFETFDGVCQNQIKDPFLWPLLCDGHSG